ncbi:MAG: archaellin/type IV pilin N-terminal domain-containing protein [Candidatus Pacearchaeota archaeon]
MLKKKNLGLNKKGVSVIIGYVLLVVFVIIISVFVYSWLKSYIPSEPLKCSEEVSLLIKEAKFNHSTRILAIILSNNGKFNIAGYFIHGSNNSSQEDIPTINLALYLNKSLSGGEVLEDNSSVLFSPGLMNSLTPGNQRIHYFDIPQSLGNITKIRIIPTLLKEIDNKNRFLSCAESKTINVVYIGNLVIFSGGSFCTPGDIQSGTQCLVCNPQGTGYIPSSSRCNLGEICNSTGSCVPE